MAKTRTVRIHVLLTEEENELLKERARADGRAVGPYLRRAAGIEVNGDGNGTGTSSRRESPPSEGGGLS